MLRRLGLALPAVLALVCVLPAAAPAATTFGSQLAGGSFGTSFNGCSGTCTYVQYAGSSPNHVSPVTGVVVRWRIMAASAGSAVKLRLLRPAGGAYTVVGSSAPQATTGGTVDVFETRLAVRAGDVLGVDADARARLFAQAPSPAVARLIEPAPADGASGSVSQAPGDSLSNQELQVSADVEPDADGDGYGDESQDTTGGAGAGPGAGGRPTISGLRVTGRGRARAIVWRLSASARTSFVFERVRPGGARGSRKTVTVTGRRGLNRLTFAALSRRRVRLPAGRYRITASVRGAAIARRTTFRL